MRYSDATIYSVAHENVLSAHTSRTFHLAVSNCRGEYRDKHQNHSEVYLIMSLSIEFDSKSEERRIFSQGELVSGKVIFNCSKSEDVAAIIIR